MIKKSRTYQQRQNQILAKQMSLKSRDNSKIHEKYSPLLNSGETQHKELSNARKKDVEYVI